MRVQAVNVRRASEGRSHMIVAGDSTQCSNKLWLSSKRFPNEFSECAAVAGTFTKKAHEALVAS